MSQFFAKGKTLFDFEKPLAALKKRLDDLMEKENENGNGPAVQQLLLQIRETEAQIYQQLTPYQIVRIARHDERPTTLDFLEMIGADFVELKGDRVFGDDPAIVAGFGKWNGERVAIIGHQKGKNTKENIARNFGMANPEGYRKALRIMQLAERVNRPIVCLIDTPGAYPGIGAEERGQAEAIARNLREMSKLQVPVVCVVTGEGGSGGALGIGVGNRVLMMQYSIYSVISPEGCAAILFRDAGRASEAAEKMKITAPDLLQMKVVEEIIPEPPGGAHHDPTKAAENLKEAVARHLKELKALSPKELVMNRYEKFRGMGYFIEEQSTT